MQCWYLFSQIFLKFSFILYDFSWINKYIQQFPAWSTCIFACYSPHEVFLIYEPAGLDKYLFDLILTFSNGEFL